MADSFIYQPHVHTADGVLTPDLVVDDLSIVAGNGAEYPLTVNLLCTATELQQIGETASGTAALVLVSAGRGTVATVGSAHWQPGLCEIEPWLGYQVTAKPISREAVRIDVLAGDPGGFVLRTLRLSKDGSDVIGETPLDALPDLTRTFDRWGSYSAPDNAALLISADHIDPNPAVATGYRVELAGASGGVTASHTYGVEKQDPEGR